MQKHGAISTFSGRLLPGVKHFISFPAGLAKMDLKVFCLYTTLGGAIWCAIVLYIGYAIGQNEELITKYIKQVNFILFVLIVCLVSFYIWKKKIRFNSEKIDLEHDVHRLQDSEETKHEKKDD